MAPILVHNDIGLITGSHRFAALKKIDEEHPEAEVLDQDIAEDITEELDERLEELEMGYDDIEYGRLGTLFEGTWVERYKDEIVEW